MQNELRSEMSAPAPIDEPTVEMEVLPDDEQGFSEQITSPLSVETCPNQRSFPVGST